MEGGKSVMTTVSCMTQVTSQLRADELMFVSETLHVAFKTRLSRDIVLQRSCNKL